MRSFIEKIKSINSIYLQMLIVIAAFLIMGVSSFIFVSGIERKHLVNDAEDTITLIQSEIKTSFLEYETSLRGFSETIRSMVLRGENQNTLEAYMISMTNLLLTDDVHMKNLFNIHGYFFSLGGVYISGVKRNLPDDFIFQEQPWFNDDIINAGKIIVSDPYIDVITKNTILTFSILITDDKSNPLCIICFDIETNKIFNHVTAVDLTERSYGILLNKKLDVIAHPLPYFVNVNVRNISSGLTVLVPELEKRLDIYERKLKNYMSDDVIVYFILIKYDWYLGIVIPVHEYYRNMYYMATFLAIIGSVMAAVLCIMLYQLSQAKLRSDIRIQQKSNFLATMSHEIRTPLNAILGMTEIQIQNTAHPPSTCEAFLKINNSGNLLLNIINDILDLSKIETGNLELVPVKYEVVNLINDLVQLNYIRYESKQIEFVLDIDANTPSVLIGDDLRIKQILNNLLSNAFKYTDKGKVVFSVSADCVGRGGNVLVTLIFRISDTGYGMSSEQVKKLFNEYTRFNMETNRITKGAGLGMTITNNLVKLMYGKIDVDSKIGKGTTVTVKLPQKTDGGIRGVLGKDTVENLRQFKLINTRQIKKVQTFHEYMPYGSVLIVDDVETNLYVAKGLIVPYGLKIDLANNGFEAIEKIKEGNVYDIVFMDHMMPKMDGIETTKLIREMGYTKPIVALTANALAGQAEVFLQNGFDDYISKPIDIRQLNIVLIRLIRERYPADVIAAAQKEKDEIERRQGVIQTTQQVDTQLAEIFARDAEKAVSVLENCLSRSLGNEEDIHMYVINVHAMKSALANIGEKALSAVALNLEQAGREKDINVMLEQTNDFIDKLRTVINKIKPKEEEENSENNESELEFLREKLKIIKEACASFDKKSAKNALGELREKTWSHEIKKSINSISEHLLHSEFDSASALADEYIK